METNRSDSGSTTGCSRPLKGCAIVAGLAILGVIALLVYLMRMPMVQSVMTCRANMVEVGNALKRYAEVNGEYPDSLGALKKEYLKDVSVLRCPLDMRGDTLSSYIYHKPGRGAGAKFVVLECCRHRLGKGLPISKLKLLKDGNIDIEKPRESRAGTESR